MCTIIFTREGRSTRQTSLCVHACERVCSASLLSSSRAVSKPQPFCLLTCPLLTLHSPNSGSVLHPLPSGLWQKPPSCSPMGPTIYSPQRWAEGDPWGTQSLKKLLLPPETACDVLTVCHPVTMGGTCLKVQVGASWTAQLPQGEPGFSTPR